MKADLNPSRTMIKQVSESSPSWASGGSYSEGQHSAVPAKSPNIVTTGSGGGDWAKGGGEVNVGKQSVKPCHSE